MTNPNSSRPTSKLAGFRNFVATLVAGGLLTGAGLWYLNEQNILARNSTVTTSQENPVTTTENNPDLTGGRQALAGGNNSVALGSGDNANISRDVSNSPSGNGNVVDNRQGSSSGSNSPSITGTSVTVVYYNNNDLPGFSTDSGNYIAPPSDLSKYSKASDLQPDSLIQQASDKYQITFETREPVINGKQYQSFLQISPYTTNSSRFVFKLDGTQKAALLQFGLPDLPSGNTSKGVYIVKIYADGNLLWGGECQISQNRQIISVPIDIPGARTLTLEVTSNGSNESYLYFTEARLLKD